MAMGAGLSETPLARRFAHLICRPGIGWRRMLVRLHLIGGILAVIVPSQIVRVQVVMPFAFELIAKCGARPYSKQSAAIVLSLVISTNHCGAGVLTGSLPNLVAHTALQDANFGISWGYWFAALSPGFFIGSGLGSLGVALALWGPLGYPSAPDDDGPSPPGRCADASSEAGVNSCGTEPQNEPLSKAEKKIMCIFALGLIAWATDALHHVAPVYVGLVCVLLMYFPHFGALHFDVLRAKVNFMVMILTISVIAVSTAVLHAEPLLAGMQEVISDVLGACPHSLRYFALLILGLPVALLVNSLTAVGIFVPILCTTAEDSGLDPVLASLTLTMAQNILFLPFQCTPILIATSLTGHVLKGRDVILVLAYNSAVALLLLAPMTFLWWYLLNWY